MTPEQKEQAKRGGLAAGTAAGLGTAAYGASLAGSGHTGIKNARYDIKNVRADRPANAKLRLKAATNVIRHGGKLKRTGLVLGAAGALGAAAAGNKLHQKTAGSTLASMRKPVQKGLTAGQMSILRQQGLDPVINKSLVNGKFVKATEAGSKALKRAQGLSTERTFTGKVPQGHHAPGNRYTKVGYKQRNAPTQGLVAGSERRIWRGAQATSPRDYRNKVLAERKAEQSGSFDNPTPREPKTYGSNPTSRDVGPSGKTKGILVGAGVGTTAAIGTGAGLHHSRKKQVAKSYTSTQLAILRQQGLDPVSKSGFAGFVENIAGLTGISIGINETQKRKKRKKVAKADKRRDTSGAVITGTGATAAGAGLVGGGIPGVRPVVPEGKGEGSRIKRARITTRSASGGIFGFRTEAHRNFLRGMEAKDKSYEGKPLSRADSFKRGLNAGKIGPEKQIIRHMKGGRIGSNVALVGGGAAAAYGVHRMRHPKKNVSKAQKDTDRAFGTALGVGGTAAAGSVVGARALEHQGRKWSARAASSLDEAGRVATKTGGHTSDGRSPNPRVKDVRPKVQPGKIARDPESFLRGHSKAKAHTVGALHGAAAQQRHFAGIYGVMGNNVRRVTKPALGVAAVGGGGLLISRHRQKVKKALTPEEVQREVAFRQTNKTHRLKNKVRYKLGMRPVQKSLVNGKWLQSSKALAAYKQGQKVGGYGKAKGMTPEHKEVKEMTETGAPWMKSVQQNPQKAHPTLGMLGLSGLAVRTGGKSSGKSTVLINPQSIARNSTGKRDYRRNKKMVLTHEQAHAEPKRSQYRSHQLNASSGKMGREEGRADYLAQGHHSGYKTKIERSYLDNAPDKEFGAAYRSVQDKMHAAGTKVRKSFPVNHA